MSHGKIKVVKNTKKKPGANKYYYSFSAQMPDGSEVEVMLTSHALKSAIYRAKQNPEDIPHKGFIEDLFD